MPSPTWPLLAPVGGPELVVGRRRRCSWRTSGSGCHGGPTLRCRGWGHPARAGTFLCGRGQVTRWGTGLLSPTASNDPAHAPGRVECPRCWREPDGYGCSVWPGPDSGAQARVSRTPLRRCVLLMSEALTQVGAGGGVVVLETRVGRGKRSGGSQSRGPDRFRQGCGGGAGHSHPTAGSLQSRAGSPYPGAGPFPCLTPLLVPVQVPGSRGSTSSPAHFCFERAYCTRAGIYWSGVVRTARGPHLPGVPPTLLQ